MSGGNPAWGSTARAAAATAAALTPATATAAASRRTVRATDAVRAGEATAVLTMAGPFVSAVRVSYYLKARFGSPVRRTPPGAVPGRQSAPGRVARRAGSPRRWRRPAAGLAEIQPGARPGRRRSERPHPVVAWLVAQFGEAEGLQQRRQVHAEAAAISLARAVPASDRVGLRATPCLDRARCRILLLVGGSERHPVAPRGEPGVQIVDRSEPVAQPGRPHLADELGRVGRLVAVHLVRGGARRRLQLPRVVCGSGAGHALKIPGFGRKSAVRDRSRASGARSGWS